MSLSVVICHGGEAVAVRWEMGMICPSVHCEGVLSGSFCSSRGFHDRNEFRLWKFKENGEHSKHGHTGGDELHPTTRTASWGGFWITWAL